MARSAGAWVRCLRTRSVYRRCLGRLATGERFPPLEPPEPGPTDRLPFWRDLTAEQHAMAALTVPGGHTLDEIAVTLGKPVLTVRTERTHVVVQAATTPDFTDEARFDRMRVCG